MIDHHLMGDLRKLKLGGFGETLELRLAQAQKDELSHQFHSALVSGGFYIMGKTEYLGRTVENLFTPYNSIQKIFIRKD